jgi:hypothetical protein
MERKFQTLLDKLLKQIFIKRMADPAETAIESQPVNLPAQKSAPTIMTFVFSVPARKSRTPEYYQSPEYFARLRQKMRVCFKQEKEVIHSSEPGASFEKKLKINEIEALLEEVILAEYSDQPIFEKIVRMEELQELYRKMVKNRQGGS